MPLTKKDIKLYKDRWDALGKSEKIVVDRIDKIIHLIGKVFKRKWGTSDYWYFDGAQEGQLGDIPSAVHEPSDDEFADGIEFISTYCDMDTDVWDYSYSFPRKFLFMDDKKIEQQIRGEIKATEEAQKAAKLKREQKKKEYKELKEKVLKKLSQAEKKALGI